MEKLNFLAVIVAALSTFLIGGLWYSNALFGKAWIAENNLTEDDIKKSNKVKTFGLAFLFALIMAFNLAMFIVAPENDLMDCIVYALLAGLGWVVMGIATIALFELRSWRYIFINGGYIVVSFLVMGLIIGAWR